ncbi:MAG: hypothetical protein ACE5HP_04230 [Gemmatimonadota bacterium]
MHPQLGLLLEIQDLQAQRAGLVEEPLGAVETEVFEVEIEEAVAILDAKVAELVGRLEPAVRSRYKQLAGRRMRVVVPVLQGICYGCFMAVPTAWASEAERNIHTQVCQNCGCFLYHVD